MFNRMLGFGCHGWCMVHRSIFRSQSGNTAIEFALIAPVMFWMFVGTFELSMYFFATSTMEGAITASSRLGKTGYDPLIGEGKTREALILETVKGRVSALMDTDKVTLTARAYDSYDDIGQPEPYTDANGSGDYNDGESYTDVNGNGSWDADMASAGYGGAEDVVYYEAAYDRPIFTPMMARLLGNETGVIPIRSGIIVKNEPWETTLIGGP